MTFTAEIIIVTLLVLFGIGLMLVELFLIPGISVAGVGAILFFVGSIYYAFTQITPLCGYITIALTLILIALSLVWVVRSKTLDRIALDTSVDSVVPTSIDSDIAVGQKGITLTRLNPMGRVRIGEKEVEAKIRVGFLDENTPVVVERVETNLIIVKSDKI